ncbi:helix-turn-helix transcriptional regulator [Marinomonas sp.]|uniref:helix-turn-helix transcriptional regulator n=1 Tax=Marinomonas sp. TaxID=1904862 RepID=UPI003BA8FB31
MTFKSNNFQNQTHERVLSLDEVAHILGRSKKSLWRYWAKNKTMPKPIQLNGRALGWKESTIEKFLNEKAGECDE